MSYIKFTTVLVGLIDKAGTPTKLTENYFVYSSFSTEIVKVVTGHDHIISN